MRNNRLKKLGLHKKKEESDFEIVDPLAKELKEYKSDIVYRKSVESSKASESLKKYIIQQEKNLRCLRLEKVVNDDDSESTTTNFNSLSSLNSPLKKRINVTLSPVMHINDEKQNKEINIAKIEDLFRNQAREYLLYENHQQYLKAEKEIQKMNDHIKFVNKEAKKFWSGDRAESIQSRGKTNKPNANTVNISNVEEYEIDKIISKNLKKSQNLQDKIYKEKRENQLQQQQTSDTLLKNSLDISKGKGFLETFKKPKKKIQLKGVHSYSFNHGNRTLSVTPGTGLLLELNTICGNKDKIEHELTGLLKNSFQNRESILFEKSLFYDQRTEFADLSPSNQFKLRKLMNKKLDKRLERSKEQVNNFTAYLTKIKSYHVILDETILSILKEVRKTLLSGKIMKTGDFTAVLSQYSPEELGNNPNDEIIKSLYEMMI